MDVESIGFINPSQDIKPISIDAAASPTGEFSAWLVKALHGVNADLTRADAGMQSLATGEAQNLHQVMIALEEARMGVQLIVQVRNRLLDAYQEILRMQV